MQSAEFSEGISSDEIEKDKSARDQEIKENKYNFHYIRGNSDWVHDKSNNRVYWNDKVHNSSDIKNPNEEYWGDGKDRRTYESPNGVIELQENKKWQFVSNLKPSTTSNDAANSEPNTANERTVLNETATYATGAGVEASLVETAARYGVGALEDLGGKAGLLKVTKVTSAIGWLGVGISATQAANDFMNGHVKEGLLHTADAGVNAALLVISAVCPAAVPFTLAIGLVYNVWSIMR